MIILFTIIYLLDIFQDSHLFSCFHQLFQTVVSKQGQSQHGLLSLSVPAMYSINILVYYEFI